jgi:hypothetical protein
VAGGAGEVVERARLGIEGEPLPLGSDAPPEAQRRRCPEGEAGHLAEIGPVPVPADPRTFSIFDDQRVDERPGAGDLLRPAAHRQQPVRHRLGFGSPLPSNRYCQPNDTVRRFPSNPWNWNGAKGKAARRAISSASSGPPRNSAR